MKKISLLLLLTLSGSLALAGCGEQASVPNVIPASTTSTTQTSTTTTATSDTTPTTTQDTTAPNGLAPFFQTADVTYNEPKVLDREDVLAPYKAEMQAINDNIVKGYDPKGPMTDWSEIDKLYNFFDVGTIHKAPYSDWKLVDLIVDCDGPCFADTIVRFAWDSNARKLVMLGKLSSAEYTPAEMTVLSKNSDESFEIQGLNPPKAIVLANGVDSIDLTYRDADFLRLHAASTDGITQNDTTKPTYDFVKPGEIAYSDPKLGDLYFDGEILGNILLKLPDGSVSSYAFDPKILDDKYDQVVKWNDNSDFTTLSEYSLMQHGCGTGGSYYIEKLNASELTLMGKTNGGMPIYEATNRGRLTASKDGTYGSADLAQTELNQTFDTYNEMWQYQGEDKKPLLKYEEFAKNHPVLYWQDPFGRYVAIINNDFKPAAECGKPVIYLYPTKTTDVSVKVGIPEFTKTEPAYGNGWNVKASPDGQIYNYADGKTYPYLFWEGKKNGGMNMNSGTVVAKADIEKFLNNSLDQLGLNSKESAEFKDFWLPKMQATSSTYVFVSFAGTSEFNKVAPLDIQPAPQTLIRVFMYYMPLNSKVDVQAQKLTSVARKGFTVVEWGGTSSDGWQVK